MDIIYEYSLFALVCTCILREALWPSRLILPMRVAILNPVAEHRAWLEHIDRARREHILGPLRLDTREGNLCVVGMGECRPVATVEQGLELINTLKSRIADLFT